jgi:hypothetical protein
MTVMRRRAMPTLEQYGKCRELGYCDCGGFFGCVDLDGHNVVIELPGVRIIIEPVR